MRKLERYVIRDTLTHLIKYTTNSSEKAFDILDNMEDECFYEVYDTKTKTIMY